MNKRPRKMAPTFWKKGDVEWIQSDWFCPACGQRDMWQEVGSGSDYYHESSVTCGSCGYQMCCVDDVEDEPEKKAPWWDTETLSPAAQGELKPKPKAGE